MKLGMLLAMGKQRLAECGIEDAESDARLLMSSIMRMSFSDLFLNAEMNVPLGHQRRFLFLIGQRAQSIPVAYLTGEREFCGLSFFVKSTVLIPRNETELLAEEAYKRCNGLRVLDLCTGSGCIAVAIAKLGNPESVVASDCSAEALHVASINAKKHDVNIELVCSDMFERINGQFDLIVTNPPYISKKDYDELMPVVRCREPKLALFGGEDGLNYYRRIATEAPRYMAKGGTLMAEIGYDQGEAVRALLAANGFCNIRVKKDYAEKDRIVIASMPE